MVSYTSKGSGHNSHSYTNKSECTLSSGGGAVLTSLETLQDRDLLLHDCMGKERKVSYRRLSATQAEEDSELRAVTFTSLMGK